MKTSAHHLAVSAALVVATALLSAGCSVKAVSGKTYVTSDGDTITFFSDGKAAERNGNRGVIYAGQMVAFGADGASPATPCTYNQNGDKLTLNCGEGVNVVFTVNNDGSLTGPPTGMFQHTAFAHLRQASAR